VTQEERTVIVQLLDDCIARKVRHFKKGDLEFEFERPEPKRPAHVPALTRLKGEVA